MKSGLNRRRTFPMGAAIAAALLGAFIAPAAGSPDRESSATSKGSAVVRLTSDISTLDPFKATDASSIQVIMSLYDRLLNYENGKIQPYLATSWKQTPSSVTLKLKKGVTCSDGSKITPTVVAASLRAVNGGPFAASMFGSAGYKVTANNAKGTVTLKTGKPFSDLLLGLTYGAASIVCPAGLKNPASLATKAYGSGPFVLTKFQRGNQYVLTARAHYTWGPAGSKAASSTFPHLLTYRVITNETTAANLLLTGGLNAGFVTGTDLNRLEKNKSLYRHVQQPYGTTFLLFNQAPGLVGDDPVVRRALFLAIDAHAFNAAADDDRGKVAYIWATNQAACYDPSVEKLVPGYDPNLALSLLKKDGYTVTNGSLEKNGQPLTINLLGWTDQNAGPEYIQAALEQLGVTVHLQDLPLSSLVTILFGSNHNAWDLFTWPNAPISPTLNQATTYLSGPLPPQGQNAGSLQNQTFDKYQQLAMTSVGKAQCRDWSIAQKALVTSYSIKGLISIPKEWFGNHLHFSMISDFILDPQSLSVR